MFGRTRKEIANLRRRVNDLEAQLKGCAALELEGKIAHLYQITNRLQLTSPAQVSAARLDDVATALTIRLALVDSILRNFGMLGANLPNIAPLLHQSNGDGEGHK